MIPPSHTMVNVGGRKEGMTHEPLRKRKDSKDWGLGNVSGAMVSYTHYINKDIVRCIVGGLTT